MSGGRCYCGTSLRRQRVLDSDLDMGGGLELNGINFVEVLDSGAPAGMAQRLLDVVFLKSDGVGALSREHFLIFGGVRIRGVSVLAAAAQPDGRTVRLTLDQAGDFSPYELSLTGAAPANMDGQLARVTFSFKVECPSDFDCAPEEAPPTRVRRGPPIDYLKRDWSGFRQLMLDRMSTTMPGWTERNPADLGVALVEALADGADRTSWFQDAVGTESFFERARYRQSLIRHARLLGYRPGEGTNARAAIALTAGQDRNGAPDILPRGTRFLTRPGGPGVPPSVVLRPDAEVFEDLVRRGAIVFEAMEPLRSLRVARNAVAFHDWGDRDCCLEPGATSAFLVKAPGDLDLRPGDLLILEERVPFGGGADDPPDPQRRQVIRLAQEPRAAVDPVFGVDLTEITWNAEDALRFPLPIGALDDGTAMAVARGNVMLVDEGRTLDHRSSATLVPEDAIALALRDSGGILPDDGPGRAQRLRLDADAIVHSVPFDPIDASGSAASASLDPTGVPVADVALEMGGESWSAVPDLLGSDRFAADFVVEPGTAPGTAYVRFGDGVLGRRPAIGAGVRASIRHGGGPRGNVGAGAIAHVVTTNGEGIEAIRNPLPASGGRAAETRTRVHVRAPQAFRTLARAVTVQDYADVAARHPAVARAFGRRRWTGSWHTITLAIDLVGGGEIDEALKADLRRSIEEQRLAGHDLQFASPIFVPLDILLYVCALPDADAADVNRDLLALFSDRDLPDGTRGLFHPDELAFGEDVALSPLLARAMQIEGVAWIGTRNESNQPVGRFARLDQPGVDYADDALLPIAGGEIARLDNDPSRPENGRIRFIVEGGR
ncbi:MAG: putative baseplate assembly protein [Pseudomonadota bacterium]